MPLSYAPRAMERPTVPVHSGMATDVSTEDTADRLAALMAAVAGHQDRDAFATLFDHFAPRLKAYYMRSGASSTASEELIQEVMLTVWRRAMLFDRAKASVSTWIFTIARNKRIDALRRERRPEVDPNDPALVPAPEASADQSVAARQSAARVRTAIRGLPQDQLRVLELHYFEEKSHGDIARELEVPLGTVKSRLRLAIARLRTILEKQV